MKKILLLSLLIGSTAHATFDEFLERVTFGLLPAAKKPINLSPKDVASYATVEASRIAYNKSAMLLIADVADAKKKVSGWEDKIKEQQALLKSYKTEFTARHTNVQATVAQMTEENLEEMQNKRAEEEKALDAIAKNIRTVKQNISNYEIDLATDTQGLEKAQAKYDKDYENLHLKIVDLRDMDTKFIEMENKIAAMGLAKGIDELEDHVKDLGYEVDLARESLERVYDNSILKGYMKQKFKKLLESNAICNAAQQCINNNKSKPSAIPLDEILDDEVFNSRKTKSNDSSR